jgi:ABC-type antimicrobial peptide transport system permease subunit
LGIPLLAGRDFTREDQARPGVAIVNEAFARYYFAGREAPGQQVSLDHVTGVSEVRSYEIVGVVGNSKYTDIAEPFARGIFLPNFTAQNLVVRTAVDPDKLAGDVRSAVHAVLKTIPVVRVTSLSDQIDATIVPERVTAMLSGMLGGLGALLAGIGLYGLLAYNVARRVSEFGIRLALGATPLDLIRIILIDSMTVAGVGLMAGGAVALWTRQFAQGLLADMPAISGGPIAFGVGGMFCAALAASLVPAIRATRVDAAEALRQE